MSTTPEKQMLGWPTRRGINKLSARMVMTVKDPGRHSDGGGLYLVVDKSGARRWAFIYRWKTSSAPGPGRLREMGLGSALAISLANAREAAAQARALVAVRIDPISAKRVSREIPTFADLADAHVVTKTQSGNSDKSIARLKRSLERYAAPLRPLSVDQIDTNAVLDILKPIWLEKPETAQKVRGHVEAVLDAAKARGFRTGENPARWKGHLDHLLASTSRRTRGHHEALPYTELPGVYAKIRSKKGVGAQALQFTILTAARSGEVFGAQWSEFDLRARLWTVPAERMKERTAHRVPLCNETMAILEGLPRGGGDIVFAGAGGGRLSAMTMTKVLRDLGHGGVTVHGFRSTFRDWVGDATDFDGNIAEAALSHAVGDQTERAYRRGDALERRRAMMVQWAAFALSGA
jgi:integrase